MFLPFTVHNVFLWVVGEFFAVLLICHANISSTCSYKKVQVGKDQEKAQSEKDSHSKNRGGLKPN